MTSFERQPLASNPTSPSSSGHGRADDAAAGWEVEVFFDGACPLCTKEIRFLQKRDRDGRIRFTDIAGEGFDAGAVGKTDEELMASIHGRLPDGTWVHGVEVFRRLYAAIGLSTVVSLTRAPGIAHALEWAYSQFAKRRLSLTGRCDERCAVAQGGIS